MGLGRRTLELRHATCKTWKSQALFGSTEHESCGGMIAFIGGPGFFFLLKVGGPGVGRGRLVPARRNCHLQFGMHLDPLADTAIYILECIWTHLQTLPFIF
jgi:hypothetical protein